MERNEIIKGLEIERACVSRDCDRDCGACDLVQDKEWLLAVYDGALKLLNKHESEAKWIYGEDKTGVDGWHCSECEFFEPWFYEFTDDIDFIRFYGYCPSCGRKMTSYTGKPTQNKM